MIAWKRKHSAVFCQLMILETSKNCVGVFPFDCALDGNDVLLILISFWRPVTYLSKGEKIPEDTYQAFVWYLCVCHLKLGSKAQRFLPKYHCSFSYFDDQFFVLRLNSLIMEIILLVWQIRKINIVENNSQKTNRLVIT